MNDRLHIIHGVRSRATHAAEVAHVRRFRVECECDAAPFVWVGPATSERAAIRKAAYQLAQQQPTVTAANVRATSVVEVN